MTRRLFLFLRFALLAITASASADRLSYLEPPCDPYYPHTTHPKLATPQWVGEQGVEAVVILSIDDMRDPAKYEQFLRPLLDRLKQIDGRGAVSIFTNRIDPQDPQLQAWLKEGLSLETHTADHPCPLLYEGDFAKAKSTYERCVDQLFQVPNSRPVAFRMPCCDSLNTPSPRFWSEIFAKTTESGNFLEIDSSVFNIFTQDDPTLPRDWVTRDDGTSRFRHYVPFKSFVNTIENYPYPYMIGGVCWEFPCVVPSDWEAQHVQQPNNPLTVQDWNRALDITVRKQGVMPIVFHPHGWIRAEQLADFVDYAQKTYGPKVQFLTFAEAHRRLGTYLLGGENLRKTDGSSNGFQLIDINHDSYLDVFRHNENGILTRIWNPQTSQFEEFRQLASIDGPHFGEYGDRVYFLARNPDGGDFESYHWNGHAWQSRPVSLEKTDTPAADAVYFLRDLDRDGSSELFLGGATKTVVMQRTASGFQQLPYNVPVALVDAQNRRDLSVRLVDLNGDGKDDLVRSSQAERQVWLFTGDERGWSTTLAEPELATPIPAFVAADGTDNGAWFHSQHIWVQNEHTAHLPDHVDRAAFQSIIKRTDAEGTDAGGTDAADESSEDAPLGRAKSLEDSLKTFSVVGNGKLEVAAAEPQISDPVAFDWGAHGELWVVEMGDYPNGANWHGPGDPQDDPGGRIKLLYDHDGDGRYETAHTFLEGLAVPTGVKAYRDGVLVCVAPRIIYVQDTDGDHRADKQQVLYEGLTEGNQQHRANGLRWGLDHWIHLANGDSGGEVVSQTTGDAINIRGRDFRIAPDTGKLELTSGQTQFGRSRDNWGNWFGNSNSEPLWHYVLDEKYQARNRFVRSAAARHVTSTAPGAAPVFPTSKTLERFNDFDRADRFTSACSPEISRNDANPQMFAYVCEPVHNLVHRAELTREGVTFSSQRAASEREQEFLTSTDNWFRPVMVRFGPDGGIWVADMYRQVIEHPEWIPMEWQKRIDHLGGNDKGRIYRIVLDAANSRGDRWQGVGTMTTDELVAALDTPNGVVRDLIQQELFERNALDAVSPLRAMYAKTRWPAARIAIVHLLREFGGLDEPFVASALAQNLVDVHLFQAALSQLNASASLRGQFFAWVPMGMGEPSQRIRLAYVLGEITDPRAGEWLGRMAQQYGDNAYVRSAVMSSLRPEMITPVLTSLVADLQRRQQSVVSHPVMQDLISIVVGTQHRPSLRYLAGLAEKLEGPEQLYLVGAMLEELANQNKSAKDLFVAGDLKKLQSASDSAATTVLDAALPPEQRLVALAVVGFASNSRPDTLQILQALLEPTNPPEIQAQALKRLRQLGAADTAQGIFARWESLVPSMRDATIREALADDAWSLALLGAIREGTIPTREVGLHHQARLLEHRSAGIRKQASELLQPIPSDREGIVQEYVAHTSDRASLSRGKEIFGKQCGSCHQLEGQGRAVGPDLTALTDKSRPAMLAAILDPNRAVEDKYLSYTVVLQSGQTFQGLLAQETATSLVLATAEGAYKDILRTQIELMQSTGKSLMPEGLERTLDHQAMNDVVRYVQSVRAARKQFAGNEPQTAPMRDDGSIRLFAMHAEIYGPDLVLEPQYRNLGFWHSPLDRAVWTIHARQAGRYRVSLDYACPEDHSGNRVQIRVHGQKLSETVQATGSWDRYRSQGVGTILLPAEPVQLTVTSDGPIDGYLFDLRTIILHPTQ